MTTGAVANDCCGYRVPKRELVTATALALEGSRLRMPTSLLLVGTLVEELANVRVTISAGGHDAYGAGDDWRAGSHDDQVLAVALARWYRDHSLPNRTARSF